MRSLSSPKSPATCRRRKNNFIKFQYLPHLEIAFALKILKKLQKASGTGARAKVRRDANSEILLSCLIS